MGASSQKVVTIPRNPEALAPGDLTDIELADQLGKKLNQVKLFKPTADRCDVLKTEMQLRCVNLPAALPTAVTGDTWRVDGSAKSFVPVLPPTSVLHRMFRAAKKDFYAACSVTQKAIKEHLGEPALEKMLSKAQTGYRTFTGVLLEKPAA